MKKNFLKLNLLLLLFVFACAGPKSAPAVLPAVLPVMPTSTLVPPVPTVIIPTVVPTATPVPEAQQKIRAIMEAYGRVDEKYLTDAYWTKMAADIESYGPANGILALEFHGDNYYMYDGTYSMTPEAFIEQMDYLMANNYHFVTGPEEVGFLEGWLQLPARSVILTTDSGAGSINSMPRIIEDFKALEAKYGYTPHMQSYIWTYGMTAEESLRCKGDLCWREFVKYLDSGYFTFGSHTESHSDFSKFNLEQTVWDLTTNQTKIKEHLGLNVYAITWPFEACSYFPDALTELGFKYAYGGWTRGLAQGFTYAEDDMPLCLPRLFPANPDGYSGRPSGSTFEEMLQNAVQSAPLH